MTRHLVLNAFLVTGGHHESAWRLPETEVSDFRRVAYYQELAQAAERAKFDSIFFADSPSITLDPARRPQEAMSPTLLLAAIAAVTERIGLIATSSTTYNEPFNLARDFASLDLLSGGRAGWNVVTSFDPKAGANFGFTEPLTHAQRYARADEFVEVVTGLWGSWDDDAIIGDKEAGELADNAKIHTLDHEGEHYRVRGPLNVGRSAQGHPVIVQAGSSGPGIALAGKYAEAVFTASPTVEAARSFYGQLKEAVVAAGRNPEHVKVLPGLVPIVAATAEEAAARKAEFDALVSLEKPLAQLAEDTGLPTDAFDLDAPLPTNVRPVEDNQGNRARYELTLEMARRDNLTVRELLIALSSGRGHRTVVGTPEQIADDIEAWFTSGAADGFNIMPPALPGDLTPFVELVVPILQKRGLFRTDYTHTTLRGHYGLPVPADAAGNVPPTV